MLKVICAIFICLAALPAFSEPAANYEVATIIGVKPHPSASDNALSGVASYEVSVQVADTVYVVLYTDTFGTKTVKYAGGRQVMVHVGKSTVVYNDILGQPHELPIISRKPGATISHSK